MPSTPTQPLLFGERPSSTVLALVNADIPSHTKRVTLDCIIPNRFQTRDGDDDEIPELAADIELNGLIHNPVVRIDPDDPGRVELAEAHRRVAAVAYLHRQFVAQNPDTESPWYSITVEVRDLSDVQMFRYCWSENRHRRDLTSIEKANALYRATTELNLTQEEAGREMGLSQSAVSHLLGLLRLPEDAQAIVNAGNVPERHARQAARLADAAPAMATAIIAHVAEAEDKDAALNEAMEKALREQGIWLKEDMPSMEADELLVDHAAQADLEKPLPDCETCVFRFESRRTAYCTRKACHTIKTETLRLKGVRDTAANMGLPFVAPNAPGVLWLEELKEIEPYERQSYLQAVLAKKDKAIKAAGLGLTTAPPADKNGYDSMSWLRRKITGNEDAAFCVTDVKALLKLVPPPAKEEEESQEQREAENRAEQERREKLFTANDDLLELAVKVLAPKAFPQQVLVEILLNSLTNSDLLDLQDMADEIEDDENGIEVQDLAPEAQQRILSRFILRDHLRSKTSDLEYANRFPACSPERTAKELYETIKAFGIHVPAQITQACGRELPKPKVPTAKATTKPAPKPAKSKAPATSLEARLKKAAKKK